MSCLPSHGRVSCSLCHRGSVHFDVTRRTEGIWRITANPMAWGNTSPEVVVLGFSKGPTQAGALSSTPHDEIAYKGSRANVGKILAHIGLVPQMPTERLKAYVDALIADPAGRFHFGSLVRCTVERFDGNRDAWKGSGGGMLDKFLATPFGQEITSNCASSFLRDLPQSARVVVLFGLGSRLNYVRSAYRVLSEALPGQWQVLNDVAYTDGTRIFVHVEHFASQGSLIPDWLGQTGSPRAALAVLARAAVESVSQVQSGECLISRTSTVKQQKEEQNTMVQSATPVAARAQAILSKAFRQVGEDTKYTAKFDTVNGRRVMIKRQVNFIGLFTERFPGNGVLDGVTLNVHKQTPGHYGPRDARASSIAADPKLGLGCEAYYVRCIDEVALSRFIDWYGRQ